MYTTVLTQQRRNAPTVPDELRFRVSTEKGAGMVEQTAEQIAERLSSPEKTRAKYRKSGGVSWSVSQSVSPSPLPENWKFLGLAKIAVILHKKGVPWYAPWYAPWYVPWYAPWYVPWYAFQFLPALFYQFSPVFTPSSSLCTKESHSSRFSYKAYIPSLHRLLWISA